MFYFNEKTYQIVHEYKEAWNPEAFRERYSDVLDRYDYIMGDWGYNQLRLKGFFKDNSSKASKETTIAGLQDYLNEYCNFGCAYFVLERVPNPNRPFDKESGTDSENQETDMESLPTTEGAELVERSVSDAANGRSERPEHRENRHRFESGRNKEQGAAPEVTTRNEQNHRNTLNNRQEQFSRKEQHRGEFKPRGDNPNRNDQTGRGDSSSRNEHRDRSRDRSFRGGGGRTDKPFENRPGGSQRDGSPQSGKTPVV